MEPTPELIRQLRQDKIDAARKMTEEQRLAAGAELFDCACEVVVSGIRMQHPDADEQQVQRLLKERIELLRERSRS